MAKSNYYDNFNPDLFNEIPNNIPKILELGCGAGALGAKYKSLNPSSHWCGLELIEEQANSARNKLDRVICTDIETNFPIKHDEKFDALIVGDVLEHLKDPWSVLRDLVSCIKPNGFICICIPNVGHWSVVANLIAGNFKYEDSGILDRTHLRFFTGSSMIELLTQANIEIKKILPRRIILNEDQYTKFCESMIPFCNEFGLEFEHIKDRASVLQYIFSGHKISTAEIN
jgi:2-polyprenyl-3-methyl-5-hydroxy-6-metoxy-1,4-benzoquinol methylase